jgi:polyisoprenoid-binding protein YceI
MATTTQAATRLTSRPAPGTYRLDPERSTITFATRHFFGLGGVAGSFAFDAADIVVAEPVERSTVAATASAASFTTGTPKRDEKVRSDTFLAADANPLITFRSGQLAEDGGSWVLRGELTVAGRVAPIELRITDVEGSDSTLAVRATSRIDRYAHGVTNMKGMAGRHLDLEISVKADRI